MTMSRRLGWPPAATPRPHSTSGRDDHDPTSWGGRDRLRLDGPGPRPVLRAPSSDLRGSRLPRRVDGVRRHRCGAARRGIDRLRFPRGHRRLARRGRPSRCGRDRDLRAQHDALRDGSRCSPSTTATRFGLFWPLTGRTASRSVVTLVSEPRAAAANSRKRWRGTAQSGSTAGLATLRYALSVALSTQCTSELAQHGQTIHDLGRVSP